MRGRLRPGVCPFVLAPLLCIAAGALAATPRSELLAVPHPVLDRLAPALRTQFLDRRAALDAALASVAPTAELERLFADAGRLYLAYDFHAAAEACLRNAKTLAAAPATPYTYYLGALFQRQRRLDEAAAEYEELLRATPRDLPTLLRLGEVELLRRRLDDARQRFSAALEVAPDSAAAHAGLGRCAAARGAPQKAVEHLEKALELQPSASSLHYPLALAFRDLGERDSMRRHLAAHSDRPVSFPDPLADEIRRLAAGVTAYVEQARRERSSGRIERAEELLRTAVDLDPDHSSAQEELGQLLEKTGRIDEAVERYRNALRSFPEQPALQHHVARLLLARGQDEAEAALGHLQTAVRLAPDFIAAAIRLAGLEAELGRREAAEARYAALLERPLAAGELGLVHFYLANLLSESEPMEKAVQHYREAVRHAPDLAEAHFNLATLLGRRGDYAQAAIHHARVVDLDSGNRTARIGEAVARIKSGGWAQARDRLLEARSRFPTDPTFTHLLARLLATAPDQEERDGERSLELASELFRSAAAPEHGETLAMALAEVGRFDDASALQRQILARLEEEDRSNGVVAMARQRLQLYERRQTCRADCAGW